MNIEHLVVELIEDSIRVAALADAVRSRGGTLVCQRCMDENEVIAGVLVIGAINEQWALCGPCWREIPPGAYIA
jgi:hypothetical protein